MAVCDVPRVPFSQFVAVWDVPRVPFSQLSGTQVPQRIHRGRGSQSAVQSVIEDPGPLRKSTSDGSRTAPGAQVAVWNVPRVPFNQLSGTQAPKKILRRLL